MSSLLIDVWTSPCSLRGVLEVALGGSLSSPFQESRSPFPCASVSHWARFATSPAPTYVRLGVCSYPCQDWIQSHGEGNLAIINHWAFSPSFLFWARSDCSFYPKMMSVKNALPELHCEHVPPWSWLSGEDGNLGEWSVIFESGWNGTACSTEDWVCFEW